MTATTPKLATEILANHQSAPRRAISRRRSLVIGAASVTTVLAACQVPGTPGTPSADTAGANKPAGSTAIEVRIQTVTQSDNGGWITEALNQDIDGRKAKQPNVTVKVETFGAWTNTYLPDIDKVFASGTVGDLVWYPPRHRSHLLWGSRRNLVRDLTSQLRSMKFDLAQFFKASIDQNSDGGKLYFLPFISEPVCPIIAINRTAAESAGITIPTDDWTFDDLAEWGQKAAGRGLFGYFRADSGVDAFTSAPFLRQWGVEPVDPTGKKATFADTKDAFIQALTYRANMVNKWNVSPPVKPQGPNYMELFGTQQKLLAMDGWPVRIGGLPKQFKSINIEFVLTPTVRKGDKRRTLLNEHAYALTKGSKNPDEALSVLTWMCGKEMGVQGVIQGFKGPVSRPDVWTDPRILDRAPIYKLLRPLMENVESDYFVANYRGEEFDAATNWAAAEAGDVTPAQMADTIQRQAQEVLDKQATA